MNLFRLIARPFILILTITLTTLACEQNSAETRRPNLFDRDQSNSSEDFEQVTTQDIGISQIDMATVEEAADQDLNYEPDLFVSDASGPEPPIISR